MDLPEDNLTFAPDRWYRSGHGPRYTQLYRHIAAAISTGVLETDAQLPPERELAELADVSRVTVRKAVSQLVEEGLLEQRRGAGTFVRPPPPKMEHSLSALLSFTEYMRQRGKTSSSQILRRGLFLPTPDEQMALGLAGADRVARVDRLRSADGLPMALEYSSLPQDILSDPESGRNLALRRAAGAWECADAGRATDHSGQSGSRGRAIAASAGRCCRAADRPDGLSALGPADRVHAGPVPVRYL